MGRQISLLWSCHIPKCPLELLPPSWYQPESGTNRKDGGSERKAQVLEDIIELLNQTAPKPILPLDVQVRKKKFKSKLKLLLDATKSIVTEPATWRAGDLMWRGRHLKGIFPPFKEFQVLESYQQTCPRPHCRIGSSQVHQPSSWCLLHHSPMPLRSLVSSDAGGLKVH